MREEEVWATLRRRRKAPSRAEQERFVARVMEAIEGEEPAFLMFPRGYFAPALGFSFALLMVTLLPLYRSLEEQSAALLFEDPAFSELAAEQADIVLETP